LIRYFRQFEVLPLRLQQHRQHQQQSCKQRLAEKHNCYLRNRQHRRLQMN
jgi:hypothetical protein